MKPQTIARTQTPSRQSRSIAEGMAEIITAFSKGEPVEESSVSEPGNWRPMLDRYFDFVKYMYRIDKTRVQVDWTKLPAWANWVAMDSPTTWVWFEDYGQDMMASWPENQGRMGTIPKEYSPVYRGDKPWGEVVCRRIQTHHKI